MLVGTFGGLISFETYLEFHNLKVQTQAQLQTDECGLPRCRDLGRHELLVQHVPWSYSLNSSGLPRDIHNHSTLVGAKPSHWRVISVLGS